MFCNFLSVLSSAFIHFHQKSLFLHSLNKFHICNARKLFHEYTQIFSHENIALHRDPTLGARATIFSTPCTIKRRLSVCYVFRAKEKRFFVDDENLLHIVWIFNCSDDNKYVKDRPYVHLCLKPRHVSKKSTHPHTTLRGLMKKFSTFFFYSSNFLLKLIMTIR